MTANELAERIGVSGPYISLIETKSKVPSEEVAERIARALEDNVDLYRSWARAARYKDDVEGAMHDIARAYRYASDPIFRRRISAGEDLGEDMAFETAAAEVEEPAAESSSEIPRRRAPGAGLFRGWLGGRSAARSPDANEAAALIEIPVLREGADPGRRDSIDPAAVVDVIRLDSRLFARFTMTRPFAYRVERDDTIRPRGALLDGDLAILSSDVGQPPSSGLHAVRLAGGIILAKVLVKGRALFLPPTGDGSDFEVMDISNARATNAILAGRVVLTLRAAQEG